MLVLERAGGVGGTTAVSDGMIYLGGGTALQRACGFEDSVEEMQKYLMASCGPEPDAERIRVYCEESAAHFDWLVAQGVPFKAEFYPERMMAPGEQGLTYSGNELVHPFRDLAKPAPRAHMPQKEGQARRVPDAAPRGRGAPRGRRDPHRRAVRAAGRRRRRGASSASPRTSEGRPCRFRARRGVVLCAGGFINNREMVRRHAPELRARALPRRAPRATTAAGS